MIVLEIATRAHLADVRWAGGEAVLGSGVGASIRCEDAGWGEREAVLVRLGDEVLLVRADGSGERRLRVGDSVEVGTARVTLVALSKSDAAATSAPAAAAPAAAAGIAADVARTDAESSAPATPIVTWKPALEPDVPPAQRSEKGPASKPAASSAPATQRAASPAVTATPAATNAAASAAAPTPATQRARDRTSLFVAPTFEEDLLATARAVPWLALSAALHGVLLILFLFFTTERKPPPEEFDLASVETSFDDVRAADSPLDVAPEEFEPLEDHPVPEAPDLDRVEDDLRELLRTPEMPTSEPAGGFADVVPFAPPIAGPSAAAVGQRTKEVPVEPAPPTTAHTVTSDERVFDGEEEAFAANRASAARLRDTLRRDGGLGKALRGMKRSDLLVVRGTFDRMQDVLEELRIPYDVTPPHLVAEVLAEEKTKVVFWNCGEPLLAAWQRDPVIAALRKFVHGGGYLFTTDWVLRHLVIPAFPGYVGTSGREKPLPEMVVEVVAHDGAAANALLRGVFLPDARSKWWVESASYDVKVLRPKDVEVLIESPELARPPLGRSPAVAVTFSVGRGRVLHLLGHYYQQKGNLAGTLAVHRLALNFVGLRLERDAVR